MWTAENTYQMIKQILYNCEADCTVLIRKPQVISGGVRTPCTLPLDPPLLWSCIYHEVKAILRKLSLSEYFKAISLYFRVYSLSGLTTARYTSSSSSLLALDFKSPFSLQYSFDGKSSPARIPSHLLNLTLSWACRSLSVVLEIDRDSPIVNIVWQTMNKDTSLS